MVAERFTREYGLLPLHLFVDDPTSCPVTGRESEAFERYFAPWPLRFYIFANGIVVSLKYFIRDISSNN
jgi:hypothetical protein